MTRAASPSPVRSRRATLLDVPWIFDLMLEGARDGVFSDRYLARRGAVYLLGFILSGIGRQSLPGFDPAVHATWTVVEDADRREVAFHVVSRIAAERCVYLNLVAVVPERRNQGHGSQILEELLAGLAEGDDLVVHCTKYARAMQHILKRHRLRRTRRPIAPQLEEYHSDFGSLS